ncbi:hypothetical protein HON59_02455 [bacterium]|nr:hypothetical protein [bacterium]
MAESRQGHNQFHWYVVGFAGATLTILFNFIKDIPHIEDPLSIFCVKTSIWFLVLIIIFSTSRNYISYVITSLYTQYERDKSVDENEAIKSYNRVINLTRVRRAITYASFIMGIVVLILLAKTINTIYLS